MSKKSKINYSRNLERDLLLVGFSLVLTIFLVRYGVLQSILSASEGLSIVSSFIAGLFFTSVFTIAPASIAIAHLSHSITPVTLAAWGAFGSMLGDLVIFLFIKDVFSEDIKGAIKASRFKYFLSKTHFGFLRWLGPLVGALIIISPLPDEIGLSLMGVSKMRVGYLIPLAFALNFIGIFAIASISLSLAV
ncbi:TPA: hypothetical protein DCQ44_00865 [Candidatus Taylorbacteria bacterium]|nr:hypothetical protein [Candidatus Taylorbacteria bacterium]